MNEAQLLSSLLAHIGRMEIGMQQLEAELNTTKAQLAEYEKSVNNDKTDSVVDKLKSNSEKVAS
jgi:hypothetical protein